MDIVSTFKGSTDKIGAVDRIIRETGMSAVDVFVQLIECNCIDGRAFRQGRFKDDWFAAKKAVKKDSIQRAESASRSLTEEIKNLRTENEKLQKQLENAKKSQDNAKNSEIPESYQKTIDTQKEEIDKLNAAIEERDKSYQEAVQQMHEENTASNKVIEQLRSEIEQLKTANASAHDAFAKLDDEKSDSDALIEDLNNMIMLRESQIEELNRKIEHLKVSDFNATADSMQLELKVKKLEEKADSYSAENIALNEQIVKLKERIRGLEEEAEVAPEDVDAELLEKIRFLEDEKEGDGLIIRNQLEKISVLENKLAIAEKFVLNQVLYGV